MESDLNIIYQYFPNGLFASDLNYSFTPECIKQWEIIARERDSNDFFNKLSGDLSKKLNCNLQDLSLRGIFDLSKKSGFVSSRKCVEFHLPLLRSQCKCNR